MEFISLEPLPGGWSGETFVAGLPGGERQVVRIHARNPGRAEVDAALMRLVRGLLPVPEVLEVRQAAGDLPSLLIMSYLPGERGDLLLPRLGTKDQAVLGARVGELVATLGGMPQPRPGEFVAVGSELTLRAWDLSDGLPELVRAALAGGLQHWSGGEGEGLLWVADAAERLLDRVDRCCLVHSDLNPKNFLVDPETLEITGVLDWEYAHAGHPFTDLGNVLRFDRAPAYVAAVTAAYGALRGVGAREAFGLARAADLWALIDLSARPRRNPVTDRAELLLRAIAVSRDMSAEP